MEENFDIEQAESVSHLEAGEDFGMDFVIPDKNIDSIYQSLLDGESGKIAGCLMRNPIREVAVFVSSDDGEDFDMSAHILLKPAYFWGKQRGMNEILDDIVEELSDDESIDDVEEVGGCYIVPTESGVNLTLSVDDESCIFSVSTGEVIQYIDEIEAGMEPIRLQDSPKLTRENVEGYLYEILNVTEVAAGQFYRGSGARKFFPTLEVTELKPVEDTGDDSMAIGDRKALLKKIEVKEKMDYTLDDIGGQEKAKEILELCSLGFKSPEVYKKWGTKLPKGILLYGPPGTGKTLMAKVLASSSDSRFLNVRWADIASGWYGESEGALKDIFDYARKGKKRTIIFFDEIDTLAPSRSGAYEGSQKVVGTLLSEMDGLRDSSNILVVGATNNMEGVDSALKRGGRFDYMIKVDLPNAEERLEIFNIHISRAEGDAGNSLFENIDWEWVGKEIDGFSGADISEVVRRVLEEKVKEELHGGNPSLVSTEDLLNVIQEYNSRHEKKNPLGFVVSK